MEGVNEDLPPQLPQYEELLEVVRPAMAKLNIDWPAKKQAEPQKASWTNAFCGLSHHLHAGACHYSLISTPRCRGRGLDNSWPTYSSPPQTNMAMWQG